MCGFLNTCVRAYVWGEGLRPEPRSAAFRLLREFMKKDSKQSTDTAINL